MSGYNSCMFAYGQVCDSMVVCDIPLNKMLKLNMFLQTGSGKTYTMMGEIYEMEGRLNEDSGITPRIFEYLFTRIREVGYLNLYFPFTVKGYFKPIHIDLMCDSGFFFDLLLDI